MTDSLSPERHLCSVYNVDPSRRHNAHRVICLLFLKTRSSDSEVRAFISQHIDTAEIPDLLPGREDDHVETKHFIYKFAFDVKPLMLTQLFEMCSRRSGFEEPLIDISGEAVGFLFMERSDWQRAREVSRALCLRMEADRSRT